MVSLINILQALEVSLWTKTRNILSWSSPNRTFAFTLLPAPIYHRLYWSHQESDSVSQPSSCQIKITFYLFTVWIMLMTDILEGARVAKSETFVPWFCAKPHIGFSGTAYRTRKLHIVSTSKFQKENFSVLLLLISFKTILSELIRLGCMFYLFALHLEWRDNAERYNSIGKLAHFLELMRMVATSMIHVMWSFWKSEMHYHQCGSHLNEIVRGASMAESRNGIQNPWRY